MAIKKITDDQVRAKAVHRINAGGNFILMAFDGKDLVECGSIEDSEHRSEVMQILGSALQDTSMRLYAACMDIGKKSAKAKRPAKKRKLETKPRAPRKVGAPK